MRIRPNDQKRTKNIKFDSFAQDRLDFVIQLICFNCPFIYFYSMDFQIYCLWTQYFFLF